MKKIIKLLFVFLCTLFISSNVFAKEDNEVTLYLFHGDGCPHCAAELDYLDSAKDKLNIKVVDYEVWYDEDNANFMKEVKEKLGVKENGVPLTIIGNSYILGYSDDVSGKIERAVKFYKKNNYTDVIEAIKDGSFSKENYKRLDKAFEKKEEKSDESATVKVPIKGKINLKKVSLSTATVIIGLLDGFNPCAMWVLLFLISVLIGMKDKKRMWILGLSFLFTSGFVYMLIMMSWLNIIVNITTSIFIRNIIAVVAIIGGLINLNSYRKSQDSGCSVVDDKKRKKIFNRIKKFTHEKSFFLALIGVVGLAISVNLVELACSAGLPLVFTQLLALNNVTGTQAFIYTLLYILFFLFDDLVVFFIAMFTMEVTGISTKYNKYSHLVGGILMLVIGILLIFKPGWLMFNF